jgi:putative oxidoreductase
VGHGTQKLFGWFGGHGPKGTAGFFASQGYRAGLLMAISAGLCEAGGGALPAFGLATSLAAALLATIMINAIASVTFKKGFMLGSELELVYLTIAVSIAAIGSGRFSLDRAIGWEDDISGVWWGSEDDQLGLEGLGRRENLVGRITGWRETGRGDPCAREHVARGEQQLPLFVLVSRIRVPRVARTAKDRSRDGDEPDIRIGYEPDYSLESALRSVGPVIGNQHARHRRVRLLGHVVTKT